MRRSLSLPLAALLATGLIASGCGDDDDGDDGGGESLSKGEFIAEADEICRKDEAELAEAGRKVETQADVEEFVTDTVVPLLRDEAARIRELGVPEDDEEEVNAILDSVESGADELEQNPGQVTSQAADPLADASRMAKRYGFEVCGQGS